MTMTHSRHCTRMRRGLKNRVATVLLLAASLLTTLGWTGEAWGQEKLPRVGILTFASATDNPAWEIWFEPFRRTLADRGWIEGKNVAFEYRSAHSDPSQLPEAAAELVELGFLQHSFYNYLTNTWK